MNINELQKTIDSFLIPGKGILAADESTNTIGKRFDSINVESTEENRRAYRELLFTTPDIEKYISGVILFEETLGQSTADNVPFPELLAKKGIIPGIKVDKGLIPLVNSNDEKTTQGLDGLNERLIGYRKQGARFAKWRVVFDISDENPSCLAIKTNAESLARYAALCQANDIIPIVEPEVLMDGNHDLKRASIVTERVLHQVFEALYHHKVLLEYIILKPNMVVAGKDCSSQPSVDEVAKETLKILQRTVPAAVPTIHFLSGGQSDEYATNHLNVINKIDAPRPWYVSFSYGRALQTACLKAWQGKKENLKLAQDALIKRAKDNSLAATGQL